MRLPGGVATSTGSRQRSFHISSGGTSMFGWLNRCSLAGRSGLTLGRLANIWSNAGATTYQVRYLVWHEARGADGSTKCLAPHFLRVYEQHYVKIINGPLVTSNTYSLHGIAEQVWLGWWLIFVFRLAGPFSRIWVCLKARAQSVQMKNQYLYCVAYKLLRSLCLHKQIWRAICPC